MAGYIRQSTFVDGDTITAALFNNEYNQLVNAFSNTTGHKHDGTTAEGPVIGLIGDAGETSPNNKVLIDTTNNYIEFYVEVSSAPVQQLYIADGAIIPVTDNDIDLGTSSLEFKDIYIDGTATIDTLTVDEAATVGTTLGVTGATTLSSTLTVTGTSTLTGNVTTTNDLAVGGNLTVTGNATISGNLTFGDADTDSINLAAEIDSNIIPNTDGTYDLGSSTKEWKDLYIDGTANIDSLVADTADINGGTIDGATIATSDITVGSGKTLDVSSGTLTLADDQISGDKVEGGTIAATTVTTLTSTTGNITNVNATTVDSTNLEVTNLKAKDGTSAGSIADSTGVVTLASSVLTTTDINGGTIDGATIATSDITVGTGKTLDVSSGTLTLADNQISGDKVEGGTIAATTITALTYGSLSDGTITITAFADEDDMSSDSATLVPTQQSVKAYVDSQVTAQDLDFQGDSGGALSIDLDSETLTIAGGTGIDTTGATNTLTVAIDSTVATLTGSQTLTNKTLTTPVISSISNTGTLTLPTSTDTLVGRATTDTLTNKTLTSPVLNTGVSGTAILDEDNMASDSATQLATQQSIKAYVDSQVSGLGSEVVDDTTPQLGGDLASNGNDILFADNDKAIFGTGSDLQIYHDGSNSRIQEGGTGSLLVRGTNLQLQDSDGYDYLTCTDGGNGGTVALKHLGSTVLSTASGGVTVTGTVNDLTIAAGNIQTNTSNNLSINTPNSLRINIDSNNDGTAENFIVGHNQTGVDASNNVLFMVAENGKAGFGTTSLNANVHIGSANATGDTTNPALQIGGDTTYRLGMYTSTEGGVIENKNGDDGIQFRVKTAGEAMRIDGGTGHVGIGTDNPSETLELGDGSSTNRIKIDSATNAHYIGYDGTDDALQIAAQSFVKFQSGGSFAEAMRIDSSGNVGIGTTAAEKRLHITDSTQDNQTIRFGNPSATPYGEINYNSTGLEHLYITSKGTTTGYGNIVFNTGSTPSEAMRIDASGNIGIGRTPESDIYSLSSISLGNGSMIYASKSGDEPNIDFLDNAFLNSAGVFEYQRSGKSTKVEQYNGTWSFANAPSGTAGATASFSERMRIDASGNVGIGTSTPDRQLEIYGTNDAYMKFDGGRSGNHGYTVGSEASGFVIYDDTLSAYRFCIDQDSGSVICGGTTSYGHNTYGHKLIATGNSIANGIVVFEDSDVSSGIGNTVLNLFFRDEDPATSATFIDFRDGGGRVGSVTHNDDGGGVTYNTTSDYRLKENVNYTWDALPLLTQLKPAKFNFIGKTDKTRQGFLAHEVSDIVPGSVKGEKDHMEPVGTITDNNGNVVDEGVYEHFCKEGQTWTQTGTEAIYQQLDYSRIVPLLTKAIQEQQTIIDDLKSRIEALEG